MRQEEAHIEHHDGPERCRFTGKIAAYDGPDEEKVRVQDDRRQTNLQKQHAAWSQLSEDIHSHPPIYNLFIPDTFYTAHPLPSMYFL